MSLDDKGQVLANFTQPTYNLTALQNMIRANNYSITMSASDGAIEMGMNDVDIVKAVLQLSTADFYKSMQSTKITSLWQDVYHLSYMSKTIYIKLQMTANAVVISFKEK